jgi:hypothetical protein
MLVMWVDPTAEVRTRMDQRVGEADRRRLAAAAGAGRAGTRQVLAGRGRRLRQAAGLGLVRTGLRLLDTGRVWS